MEKDVARHVVRMAFRSAAHLEHLLPLLKDHCSGDEYKVFAMAVAKAIGGINTELTNRVFSAYPELEREIEDNVNKYGRIL